MYLSLSVHRSTICESLLINVSPYHLLMFYFYVIVFIFHIWDLIDEYRYMCLRKGLNNEIFNISRPMLDVSQHTSFIEITKLLNVYLTIKLGILQFKKKLLMILF